jgi:uncharacterized protein YuzE
VSFTPVTYDPESDALYVRLNDLAVAKTKPLDDLRLIDYSADGAVVGVEFLEASYGVDLSDVPHSHRIDELIGESGLPIKVLT